MRRRALLAGLAGTASALAGCTAPDTRNRRPAADRTSRLAVETATAVGTDAVAYRATVRQQPTGGSPGRVEVACVNRRDTDLEVTTPVAPPLPPVGGTEVGSSTDLIAALLVPVDDRWRGPRDYDDRYRKAREGCWRREGRVGRVLISGSVRLEPGEGHAVEYLFLTESGYCDEDLAVEFREPVAVDGETATAKVVVEVTAASGGER